MSNLQSIDSQDLSIGSLLNDFYTVPSYQREYVWGQKEVEQLLVDIHDEFTDSDPEQPAEYFIGSIVVLRASDGTFELIDGQQRTTTLFLILCALRDHLKELNANVPQALAGQIAATSVDAWGEDLHRYRVSLLYDDSRGVLEAVASGATQLEGFPAGTRSVSNILSAYGIIRDFLQSQLGEKVGARRFYAFLTHNVKLIRVQTASIAHALKVFETINDRGVGLDAMDLLKNLLFMHSSPRDFDALKDHWKDLVDTLYKAKEKPLRFLRYFIFANYDVDRLREDEIYSWLTDKANKDLVGYEKDAIGFTKQLLAAAQAYVQFLGGKNSDGTTNRYLSNISHLSGAARQHLILLLAARRLPKVQFVSLSRHLENLFFAYIITREPTKEFERTFARWARELRVANTESDLDAFINTHFVTAKRELASRFLLAFEELRQSDLQRYRITYVLAKITQFVDETAHGTGSSAANLETYINREVQIEHILPQTSTDEVLSAFDRPEAYDDYMMRFGNLVLLERSINSSIGNGQFSQKRAAYRMSKFLLTKSLGQVISVGAATAYERAAEHLEEFASWQASDIERRQAMLGRLAWRVWDMPEPVHS